MSDLRTLRIKDGKSASDFVVRFEAQVAKLALKDPPSSVHDAILMPYLANALPDSYEEVKKRQTRGEYGIDMSKLINAIIH